MRTMLKTTVLKAVIGGMILAMGLPLLTSGMSQEERVFYGADREYPPWSYESEGALKGFDVTLLREIFREISVPLSMEGMEWSQALSTIENREIDIISSLMKTEERSEFLLFSKPIATIENTFFGFQDRVNFSVEDMANYRIGVGLAHEDAEILEDLYGQVEKVFYSNLSDAVQALARGDIDLIFGETQTLRHYAIAAGFQGEVKPVAPAIVLKEYHYGIRRDRPDLQAAINEGLEVLIKNGRYETLYRQYIHQPSPYLIAQQQRQTRSQRLLAAMGILMTLMVARYWGKHQKMMELQGAYEQIKAMEAVMGDQLDQMKIQQQTLLEKKEQLKHMAFHDDLTTLPNLKAMKAFMTKIINEIDPIEEEVAFLLMDLDNFKSINDMYGHHVGDELLKNLAKDMKHVLPEQGFLARTGGDEFSICVPGIRNRHGVTELAESINEIMRAPRRVLGVQVYISAGIGISFYPADAVDEDTMFASAEAAMYLAKGKGRHQVEWYSNEMHQRLWQRMEVEVDLRKAIFRNELKVHYQPIVSARDESIMGLEALLRWEHPQKGMVSPAVFIPVAEESGEIVALGWWSIGQICRDIHYWENTLLKQIRVSVNLSLDQLHHPDFIERFHETCQNMKVSPSCFRFEVTESVTMANVNETIHRLKQLNAMGCELSLDDFGTGFSSMSYLQQLPVQELKIDKSFIRKMTDKKSREIVSTMIHMAHVLGKNVVAEGVEKKEEVDWLKDFQCDKIQGYYYHRPMPLEELLKVVSANGKR
ncbi:EAL domain-containing protein [Anoxynatronum sibiricum]|uniref:EAL domain-containing protein n=1 Tax=Anoxynatronum sibiricum TaxID=210623 RepID=A0ABU9VWH1_9CLOT